MSGFLEHLFHMTSPGRFLKYYYVIADLNKYIARKFDYIATKKCICLNLICLKYKEQICSNQSNTAQENYPNLVVYRKINLLSYYSKMVFWITSNWALSVRHNRPFCHYKKFSTNILGSKFQLNYF